MMWRSLVVVSLALFLVVSNVRGDIYMHHPPGSNNRNREQNDNRNNANRMFDSENNDKGGYPYCGSATKTGETDGLEFYQGSKLEIQWTLQHSCGKDSNQQCMVVLQYMCDPMLRDGYPTGPLVQNQDAGYQKASFTSAGDAGNRNDGTWQIPFPASLNGGGQSFGAAGVDLDTDWAKAMKFYNNETVNTYIGAEFGYHETAEYYRRCVQTSRNLGLYLADRKLNGPSARFTRQNTNGNRHGLECPEERDYYPWWMPSPWVDIAVYTSTPDCCKYFEEQSENVKGRAYCNMTAAQRQSSPGGVAPYQKELCTQKGGQWIETPSHGKKKPICKEHPWSKDNSLGPVKGGLFASHTWEVPEDLAPGSRCVVRLRYNMSTADYNSMNYCMTNKQPFDEKKFGKFIDWKYNCETTGNDNPTNEDDVVLSAPNAQCMGKLTADIVPLYNRPFVQVTEDANKPKLGIAFNTNQLGRTFEDRSYVFGILENKKKQNIYNLNIRGTRGNIVQAFPSVEYDFVPSELSVDRNDRVHIQFCGSDFTTNRNPNNGEGWRFSTRTNMMQSNENEKNFPLPVKDANMWPDKETAERFAFVGMDLSKCDKTVEGDNSNTANNKPGNCAKLNPAPARYQELVQFTRSGTYHYLSTRNNNFSNRSQKGKLIVGGGLTSAETAGVVIGVVAGVGLLLGGIIFCVKKQPSGLRVFSPSKTTAPARV